MHATGIPAKRRPNFAPACGIAGFLSGIVAHKLSATVQLGPVKRSPRNVY